MAAHLESIQRAFAEALDDDGHQQPLHAHVQPVPAFARLDVAQSNADAVYDPGAVRRRIGLYRGNVRSRWRAALANAYPVIQSLVGDEYFDALSSAYASAHPSQSGDLRHFGSELPRFIAGYVQDARFRYFADFARLEWALHVAYYAADATSLTTPQWVEIGEERLLNARLAIHPACTAIESGYAVADIWFAHQPGGVFPAHMDLPTWVLTVRPQWQPTVLIQSACAHATFLALQLGKSLNEALDLAFAIDPAFDFASQLRIWIAARAVTNVIASL